ncbi:MAG: hypothetical protein JEZ09_08065 [Salinivirgaceae bacterium]|nr:hypothetical protein [Salinivirgaceae bacterium]
MNKNTLTIGVYGIQDINDSPTPTISHDHSIAILKKGEVIYQAQLERLDRIKHSNNMPESIYKLLKDKKLLGRKIDFVFVDNVAGRSFINSTGNIRFEAPLIEEITNSYEKGKLFWFNIQKTANILNHELAHMGSCLPFFGLFKNNSLLIHFDGGASLSNFSAWHFIDNNLSKIEAHWKLKKLSSLFNANALTFGIIGAKAIDLNSVPGKLMGFSSYGKYSKKIETWLENNNYFEDCWKSKKPIFESAKAEFNIELKQLNQKDSFIQNIAASIQEIFIRETLKYIERLKKESKAEYLYYSGGSALNIVLNTRIIKSELFKDVFIPPCCNDSGLALGAAAFYDWKTKNEIKIHDPYLNNWDIEDYETSYTQETIENTAKLLREGKIIGLCNNAAEIGPRALGNRSILCLANSQKLARKVSMEHKQREWYRPVAPIMLEENTKYFTGLDKIHHLSKYMLLDFEILQSKKKELEGAVHIDGSSRIQTIFHRKENPFVFDLLSFLNTKGIRALINTSFNTKGEPIVHTIEDAKKSAQNMKLDAVVLNGKIKILNV